MTAWRRDLTEGVTALTAASLRAREDRQGRQLYGALIAPFGDAIATAKHLLIAPDGVLGYLPFEAMRSPRDGRLLIEHCSIAYSQSASATLELRTIEAELARAGEGSSGLRGCGLRLRGRCEGPRNALDAVAQHAQ